MANGKENNKENGKENGKSTPRKPARPRKPPAPPTPGPKGRFKTLAFWVLLFLLLLVASKVFYTAGLRKVSVDYTQFESILADSNFHIVKAYLSRNESGYEFEGHLMVADTAQSRDLQTLLHSRVDIPVQAHFVFTTQLLVVEKDMLKEWRNRGINIEIKRERDSFWMVLVNMLPWIFLFLLWLFIMRQMQSGGQRGIFSFGKSRAKMFTKDKPTTTFDDVAGVDEAKMELEEIIEFLREPKKFNALGGKIPKGALLLGPPGTGKTLLARAVAGEAGVPFFSMSGSDFVEMFVGVGASRVRDLFEQGKKNAPCIVFIDEIDAVGRHRGAGLGGGHDEREQTLNQLLVEMDGFEANSGVILIAATNRPDVLDPALLRPGRFDRQVVVDRPDIRGREGILRVHTRNLPLGKDVDVQVVARGTPGLSGADLANICNEAALLAARYDQKEVNMLDFEEAKDKVMMGPERKSMLIDDKEKKIIAYHECGHALLGKLLPNTDPVHKVTVIPRGLALGVTFSLPKQDQYIRSKNFYLDRICMGLGGRAAEMLCFKETYSGASNDIATSTEIVRKMVCEWGMSEELGPVSYGKKDQEIFLGREITQHRDYSDETAEKIDQEVNRIIESQYSRACRILEENREKLETLALAVLEHELLDGEEIDRVLAGEKLVNTKKPRPLASWRKKRKLKEAAEAAAEAERKSPNIPVAQPVAPAPPPSGEEKPPEDPDLGKKIDTQG